MAAVARSPREPSTNAILSDTGQRQIRLHLMLDVTRPTLARTTAMGVPIVDALAGSGNPITSSTLAAVGLPVVLRGFVVAIGLTVNMIYHRGCRILRTDH
jgi:hypothetical protein